MILLNICSITEKYRNTDFLRVWGWQKLKSQLYFIRLCIADSSTDFLQNFTLSISSKIPLKSSKILFLFKITCYRTQYRQNPLKSSISATSQPKIKLPSHQKSNHKFKIFLIYKYFHR